VNITKIFKFFIFIHIYKIQENDNIPVKRHDESAAVLETSNEIAPSIYVPNTQAAAQSNETDLWGNDEVFVKTVEEFENHGKEFYYYVNIFYTKIF